MPLVFVLTCKGRVMCDDARDSITYTLILVTRPCLKWTHVSTRDTIQDHYHLAHNAVVELWKFAGLPSHTSSKRTKPNPC
jgi:hypothetical protein